MLVPPLPRKKPSGPVESVVIMDTLPYGSDAAGTLPMPVSPTSTSLPADVAAAVARESREIEEVTKPSVPGENAVPEAPVPVL